MANYRGRYTSDLVKVFEASQLQVSFFLDGVFQVLSPDSDAPYLPLSFQEHISDEKAICTFNGLLSPRKAQCFFNQTDYILIPCPWQGGTQEFKNFFTELATNPQIILVLLEGETTFSGTVNLFAK